MADALLNVDFGIKVDSITSDLAETASAVARVRDAFIAMTGLPPPLDANEVHLTDGAGRTVAVVNRQAQLTSTAGGVTIRRSDGTCVVAEPGIAVELEPGDVPLFL
jgi:hypothetical protein